jgi:hypothetical protein
VSLEIDVKHAIIEAKNLSGEGLSTSELLAIFISLMGTGFIETHGNPAAKDFIARAGQFTAKHCTKRLGDEDRIRVAKLAEDIAAKWQEMNISTKVFQTATWSVVCSTIKQVFGPVILREWMEVVADWTITGEYGHMELTSQAKADFKDELIDHGKPKTIGPLTAQEAKVLVQQLSAEGRIIRIPSADVDLTLEEASALIDAINKSEY